MVLFVTVLIFLAVVKRTWVGVRRKGKEALNGDKADLRG